eukprot:8434075-Lingulodinium_polyedra.AAC.1
MVKQRSSWTVTPLMPTKSLLITRQWRATRQRRNVLTSEGIQYAAIVEVPVAAPHSNWLTRCAASSTCPTGA